MECRVAGHCGHDSNGALNNGAVFGLTQQVAHHLDYVQQRLGQCSELRLVLCGHSVGACIALRLLEALASSAQESRIARVLLLFPTIMEIAETPNGQKQWYSVQCRRLFACFAGCVSCCIPRCVRHCCIKCADDSIPQEDIELVDGFLSYNAVNNAIFMYETEAALIKGLDTITVAAFAHKMLIYFGATDEWAPLSHRDAIFAAVPKARVTTDAFGAPHAFGFKFADKIASVVVAEIKSLLHSIDGVDLCQDDNEALHADSSV